VSERRVCINVHFLRRHFPPNEQDGKETRRELVLVHDVLVVRLMALRGGMVAPPVDFQLV